MKTIHLFCLFILISSSLVLAQSNKNNKPIRFILEGGVEYGGDEILKVLFTNGESQTMRAGQGGLLTGGLRWHHEKINWLEARATIGVKANSTAADNANIFLVRYPVNLLAYLKANQEIRIGGGITKHLGVKLNGDGFLPDQDYSNPIGLRIELGYKGLVLSYSNTQYTIEALSEAFSANSFGVHYSHLF